MQAVAATPPEASGCPLACFEDVVADDPLLAAEMVVDQLAAVDLPSRVGEEILRLDRLRARLEAQISRRLSEFDRRLEHTIRSHRSAAAWLESEGSCVPTRSRRSASSTSHSAHPAPTNPTLSSKPISARSPVVPTAWR